MARTRKPTKSRNKRGSGTLYQRTRRWQSSAGPRQRTEWVAVIQSSVDGKRVRKEFAAPTAREARRLRDEALALAGKTVVRDPEADRDDAGVTVAEYAETFLAHARREKLRERTIGNYSDSLRLYVLPYLGSVPVAELNALKLRTAYAAMRAAGVSDANVFYAHSVIKNLCSLALEEGIIDANPALAMPKTAPKYTSPKIEVPSKDQIDKILAAADGHRLKGLVCLAVRIGARIGELLGLHWSDLDLERGTLSIQRSVAQVKGRPIIVDCKTKGSRRTINLPKKAIETLKARLALAREEGFAKPDDFVFPNRYGHALMASNWHNTWDAIRTKAGVDCRWHDLRHWCASQLLAANVPINNVSHLLGHANPRTTLSIYSHLLPDSTNVTAGAMDQIFG
jgi:integrase